MTKAPPKVYIAVEGEDGQLVIDGPLSLLDKLVAALSAQKPQAPTKPAPPAEPAKDAQP